MERRRKIEPTGHRGDTEVLRAIVTWIGLTLFLSHAAADDSAVKIVTRYNVRTAHVEAISTTFAGNDEVSSGSGLLIGDIFVLTNNHVIPRIENYKTQHISVRLRSRLLNPQIVAHVYRDPSRDLALLELSERISGAGGSRCPMPVIRSASDAPMGTQLFVLGFPLDQNLSISGGLVSNQDSSEGRWQTDTLINSGNSGGPAFNSEGMLVGIAQGGITSWSIGGEKHDVDGVNFIIPALRIVESPLYEKIKELAEDRRCWGPGSVLVDAIALNDLEGPLELTRSFEVSETKDDHPVVFKAHSRRYDRTLLAEPGYVVQNCRLVPISVNHAQDAVCNILPGGIGAKFEFTLRSGPIFDRWRGWWTGSVSLGERRAK